MLPALYTLPICDSDLRATHARTLLPAALASVSFGFVLVRVRVQMPSANRLHVRYVMARKKVFALSGSGDNTEIIQTYKFMICFIKSAMQLPIPIFAGFWLLATFLECNSQKRHAPIKGASQAVWP